MPRTRVCSCGSRVGWSHLEYLGSGRSLAIFRCAACGLAYRGEGAAPAPGSGRQSRKPLPQGGSPENPVLDPEVAERLRHLLGEG